jgi:hypothetical protein
MAAAHAWTLTWSVIPISDKPVTMPRVPLQEKIDKSVPAAGSHVNRGRLLLIAMVDFLRCDLEAAAKLYSASSPQETTDDLGRQPTRGRSAPS